MSTPEVGWAEAARRGDRHAFDALHRRYRAMVHGILLCQLPANEVEDSVQEVFLLAWRRIGTLERPEAIGGWLAAIARNYALDAGRARKRRSVVDAVLRVWDGGAHWMGLGHWSGVQSQLDADRVVSSIRQLPEAYRETLMLRLVSEMSGEEIATQTGLSEGSVRVNLHRGLTLLRQQWGDGFSEEHGQHSARAARPGVQSRRRQRARRALAGAALLFAFFGLYAWKRSTTVPAWAWLDGDGACANPDCRFDPGETASGVSQIALAHQGRAALGEQTRLRRESAPEGEVLLTLESGPLFVAFDGEPRQLIIHTPAADVVDLGCQFEVEVRQDQSTVLAVTHGVVALEHPRRTVRVPAGAIAVARYETGPGTPVRRDSSRELASAVDRFDVGWGSAEAILEATTEKDTLTLWNLMNVPGVDNAAVIDRLLALEPSLSDELKPALIAGEEHAQEAAWEAAAHW